MADQLDDIIASLESSRQRADRASTQMQGFAQAAPGFVETDSGPVPTYGQWLAGLTSQAEAVVVSLLSFNYRGPWQPFTQYAVKDVVVASVLVDGVEAQFMFVATQAHTSGPSFQADLDAKRWAVQQGVTGDELRQAQYAVNFNRSISFAGNSAAAIVGRVTPLGLSDFTVGMMIRPTAINTQPGLVGGLAGSLQIRLLSDGRARITATSQQDVGESSGVVRAGRWSHICYERQSGTGTVYIDGAVAGSFPDNVNYGGDIGYLGSTDGVNAIYSGLMSSAFVSSAPLGAGAIERLATVQTGRLTGPQVAGCALAMSDAGQVNGFVIPGLLGTQRSIVLPIDGVVISSPKKSVLQYAINAVFGTLNVYGDSQTRGFNNSGNPIYTSNVGGEPLLKPEYRWVDMYATSNGRNLTVNNQAVTGSGLRYIEDQPTTNTYAWKTQFYAMGTLDKTWTGQVIMVPGWNDFVGDGNAPPNLLKALRRSMDACAARACIVDYGGITTAGTYSEAGITMPGWATNGTDITLTPPGADCNPFPIGGAANNVAIRKIRLQPGEYIQFNAITVRDIIGFFEMHSMGLPITVSVNGDALYSDTTYTDLPNFWPMAIRLMDIQPGDVVRFTAGGTMPPNPGDPVPYAVWLAMGLIGPDNAGGADRTVIMASTTGNPNGHTVRNLQAVQQQARLAAAAYADFGVMFADLFASWQPGDNDPQDLDHISPQGNVRIRDAIAHATPVAQQHPEWHVHLRGGPYMQVGEVVNSNGFSPRWLSGLRLRQILQAVAPSRTVSLDVPNVPANQSVDLTAIFLSGATAGRSVGIGHSVVPSAGLVFQAWATGTDTIMMRVTNTTAADIDPGAASYTFTTQSA